MKVRATKLGYYNLVRKREGVEFELRPYKVRFQNEKGEEIEKVLSPEEQFSSKWMEKVDEDQPQKFQPKVQKRVISQADDVI